MNNGHLLTQRKATLADLPQILNLLFDDEFGQTRENVQKEIAPSYVYEECV